ncbi:hypothetical protein QQM79_16200, partial [Marinobacteraceae bacterium S3BR75-40.1]
ARGIDPAPIQTTKLPATSEFAANSPTTWAHCRRPEKTKTWLPHSTAMLLALAITRSIKLPLPITAKAHAPNHQKMTEALAYNAMRSGRFV